MKSKILDELERFDGIIEGEPWMQGDHMIFVQQGVPAIVFASESMQDFMMRFTHTSLDTPEIVDCEKLVEAAKAVDALIRCFE